MLVQALSSEDWRREQVSHCCRTCCCRCGCAGGSPSLIRRKEEDSSSGMAEEDEDVLLPPEDDVRPHSLPRPPPLSQQEEEASSSSSELRDICDAELGVEVARGGASCISEEDVTEKVSSSRASSKPRPCRWQKEEACRTSSSPSSAQRFCPRNAEEEEPWSSGPEEQPSPRINFLVLSVRRARAGISISN